jgi:hypothetical protein
MSHSTSTTIRVLPQEELSSLLDKLSGAAAEQITLVIPDKSVVAQGVIGLQLLADEARRLGKSVVISSDSAQIQRLARRVGLEVPSGEGGVPEHGFMAGADVAELEQSPNSIAEIKVRSAEPEIGISDPEIRSADMVGPKLASQNSGLMAYMRRHGWKWAAGVVVLLLLLVGGIIYALDYYLPHATVTVYAAKQTLNRDINVTVDPRATSANIGTLTVPGVAVTATASKSQSFPATGTKDVGTKAGGTVTIYNKTNQDKTFAAGTVLMSGSLQFLLTKAVTVSAATVDVQTDPITLKTTNVTTPGTADASMSAADIGDNYNLDAKTTFSIAKFDTTSFSARNDVSLSGGTKKSVKVVTASDQSSALSGMETDVQNAATQTLKAKVSGGSELLDDATTLALTAKDYSQEVGAQADTFTLSLEVTANGLKVNPQDIQTMLNSDVQQKVPDGYTLDAEHSTIENHVVRTDDDGTVHLTSTYKAQVTPKVDTEAMRKAIAGKNPSVVQDYLKNQPNLHGYDITLTPKLPGPFYHLPSLESHIKIVVQVK